MRVTRFVPSAVVSAAGDAFVIDGTGQRVDEMIDYEAVKQLVRDVRLMAGVLKQVISAPGVSDDVQQMHQKSLAEIRERWGEQQ